jgi:hypothetical protein
VAAQDSGDSDPVVFGAVEGKQKSAEEASGAWDGGRLKSEFSEDSLMLLVSHTVRGG